MPSSPMAAPPPRLLLPRAPISTPAAVFVLTYLVWASIHAARKSYSVIKPTLLKECVRASLDLDGGGKKGRISNQS